MPDDTPLLLTTRDVCQRLNISRTTLHQIRHTGAFAPTVHKLAGKLLVRADELEQWVEAGLPHRNEWRNEKRIRIDKNAHKKDVADAELKTAAGDFSHLELRGGRK